MTNKTNTQEKIKEEIHKFNSQNRNISLTYKTNWETFKIEKIEISWGSLGSVKIEETKDFILSLEKATKKAQELNKELNR